MKFKQKNIVIYSIFIYVVLLILVYFLSANKRQFKNVCTYKGGCIRFCCENLENCNDSFFRENFNASALMHPWASESDEGREFGANYKILYGKPTCDLELKPSESNYTFLIDGDVKIDESYNVESYNVRPDEYCLQDYKQDDNIEWNLYLCKSYAPTQWIIHCILIAASVVILSAAVFMYAYFKSLRSDNHGKIAIFFLTGVLITMGSIPFMRIGTVTILMALGGSIFIGSFIFTAIWMTVMCFDIWFTFRNLQQVTDDGSDRFKYYCYFFLSAFIFVSLSAIITLFEVPVVIDYVIWIVMITFFLFIAMVVADLVFLILVGIKIFKMSRSSNLSEYLWLEEEKTRFWSYIQVFGIIAITGPLELYSMSLFDSPTKTVIDFVKFFSSILLFAIFVLKDKPRKLIFKRYDALI